MKSPIEKQETLASVLLIAIGLLLLVVGLFFDPMGSSPDSGIINLGVNGSQWLLNGTGGIFVLVGLWTFFK